MPNDFLGNRIEYLEQLLSDPVMEDYLEQTKLENKSQSSIDGEEV
ncbi:hypothetical protein Barb4_01282 [Bacteroidales bacterium Barb4]|nr:hypothetical protein Barb4_01282 [Bacteroidales bacterium Barb4]